MSNEKQTSRKTLRRIATTIIAPMLLASAWTASAADSADKARLTVRQSDELGAYLADKDGKSLYLFEKDQPNTSNCYDACAEAWPPLLTSGEPAVGEGVDKSKVGTINRRDGSQQVTYGDWPLYYFSPDKQIGDTKGQDVKGFGAEWYLVKPEGGKVGHAD